VSRVTTLANQWLEVQAGTRRSILRRFVPSLTTKAVTPQFTVDDYFFKWDSELPSLRLLVSGVESGAELDCLLVAAENLLDNLMALHRWDEQPLLEWPGPERRGILSVRLLSRNEGFPGGKADSELSLALYRLMPFLRELLECDGAVVKCAWLGLLRRAFEEFPGLQPGHVELLSVLPDQIARRVICRWTELSTRTIPHPEGSSAWPHVRSSLTRLKPQKRAALIDALANRLAFRPDEASYAMLLTHTHIDAASLCGA